MDLSKEPTRSRGSVADFRHNLIRRITDKTVAELAQEKGISPADLPKWSLMVERAEKMAKSFEKTLAPASQVRELEGDIDELEGEIEELRRLLGKQAVVLQILEKKGMV